MLARPCGLGGRRRRIITKGPAAHSGMSPIVLVDPRLFVGPLVATCSQEVGGPQPSLRIAMHPVVAAKELIKVVCRNKKTGATRYEAWYSADLRQVVKLRENLDTGLRVRELIAFKLR